MKINLFKKQTGEETSTRDLIEKIKKLEAKISQQENEIKKNKENIAGIVNTLQNVTITLEGYKITLQELLKEQQKKGPDYLLN